MQLFDLTPYRSLAVCVALSGGADSVCLLHFFMQHAAKHNISLSAIHIEHGIRGEESLRDMQFCQKLCKEWNIPLHLYQVDLPSYAKAQKLGLEEAGRKVRYEQFSLLLQEKKADVVATAHHQNDVAETVLFRLARGTALSGMRAISERPGIVRPLIQTSKRQILEYVQQNGLSFVEDGTNTDERYSRNYIRRSVLPALEEISPNAAEHVARFAALATQDEEYLSGLASHKIVQKEDTLLVPIDLPNPIFLRACLAAMTSLGVQKDYTGAHFEAILQLKTRESGKKICLPYGVEAAREHDKIVFYRPQEAAMEEVPFYPEYGDLLLREGNGLKVDMDAFPQGCVIRTRREGDVITPFGGRSKSLKKFLTDKKISSREGRKIKLIACGSEVLVVLGVEISDKVKVTKNTTRVGFLRDKI